MDAPEPTVEVAPAAGDRDLAALRRLYPLYLHDLSAFTEHYALDEDAQWQPSYLEDWLTRPGSHSLLIRADGRPAGFALVAETPFPYMPRDVDYHLAEFFVAAPYRRRGVGRAAALDTLQAFQGTWNLSVVDRNLPALAFWRAVIADLTGCDYNEAVGVGELSLRLSTGPSSSG
ncbi:MAG: GNAT family N-acetyltransferase [Gaiellaceae bacterium MAG52_C11]|nr:GNAT family N-acetyltransferase [Candidatus Gaiellasilicea maunaloa]